MSQLLSPTKIAGLELKNRVVMSPMCMFCVQKQDGIPTNFHFAHYGARAIGQVGMIIIESTGVLPDGRISPYDLGLWNDDQQKKMKELIEFIHSLGSKVGIQINHAGRKAEGTKNTPIAPSAIPFDKGGIIPVAMSIEQIHEVQEAWLSSIKRAIECDIDMVEIHGAHGYLVDQFLSPATNRRTDGYGGSLEKRYRFVREIIERVRAAYKGSLWIRLSLTDYLPDGEQNSMEDWKQVAKWLERDGIDCIDCSTGGLMDIKPDIPIIQGYQTPYATQLKEAVSIPIATVGLLDNPGLCEYILSNGQADLILEGREFIRNADWLADAAVALHDHDFKVASHAYWLGQSDAFRKMSPEGFLGKRPLNH